MVCVGGWCVWVGGVCGWCVWVVCVGGVCGWCVWVVCVGGWCVWVDGVSPPEMNELEMYLRNGAKLCSMHYSFN